MNIVSKEKALAYLKSGKTVVFPTETSYGLGCDAANQKAVDKVFQIKVRRSGKPLLVVAPTVEMARKYLVWDNLLDGLSIKHWPGALTVVGKIKRLKNYKIDLASGVVGQDGTVAMRVTNAEMPRYLSAGLGRPVVATSANIAEAGDVYDSAELLKMFSGREFQPDAIIDAGVLPKNPPTTIVSVVGGELKVLRRGSVVVSK